MSNLGLRRAMSQAGVRLSETPVGDRYVLQALADGGFSLGGEQSGHLIFADLATTGDGLLSGVVLSDLVARMDQPSGELGREIMTSFPQVLLNVKVAERPDDVVQLIGPEIVAAEVALGKDGRVLVRASGTEPLVRVMVEAATEHLASQTAQSLVSAVRSRLG
jgi:phosphoglucosamine mutase